MLSKKINKSSNPSVKTNKQLNKLAKEVLFPKKVDSANRLIKRVGLPE